jgi:hypothetical protein
MKIILKAALFVSLIICAQIENQVRDDNPGLFKNQRVFHIPPKPLFKDRIHKLNFITDIPTDSIITSSLFFKTNLMDYYQEIQLLEKSGLFSFVYNPKKYPGKRLQYYFIIKTIENLFGVPINDKGELQPVDKLLINPKEYFNQQRRLNK